MKTRGPGRPAAHGRGSTVHTGRHGARPGCSRGTMRRKQMSARPRKAPPGNASRTFPSGDSAQCAGGGGGGGELQSHMRGRPDVCRTTIEAIPCVCGCVCVCVARTCSCVITSTETAVELRASLQASVTDGGWGTSWKRKRKSPGRNEGDTCRPRDETPPRCGPFTQSHACARRPERPRVCARSAHTQGARHEGERTKA